MFACAYRLPDTRRTHVHVSMYTYNLLVPDLSHEVLEIVDCCNVVVVHFDFHVRVDPPGREERWRERWKEGEEVEGRRVGGGREG